MKTVEERAAIRHAYHNQKKSIRQIARELQVSRQFVRKAIDTIEPPVYTLSAPRLAPKLGPYKDRIHELLAANDHLPRKQRYTLRRIFDILQQEGYSGSSSHIRGYVAALRDHQQRPPVFLPLSFEPGQDAQVDWGEAVVVIAGERQTVQLFVMRLCYSRRTFAMAFPTQRQEAFFWAHVQAFHFFGGIPHRLTYDNLATAVQPVLQGQTRQEQRSFTAFRSHYLFESHFCTPAQGHEKGQVEHAVGYVRRNALVPIPKVESFDDLNRLLLEWCHQDGVRVRTGETRAIGDLWKEELPLLRPLPVHDFPCCVTKEVTLTPYCQVVFDGNRYSVPADSAVKHLVVKGYPFHVEVLAKNQLLARHPRCYDHDQDVFEPLHYLSLLAQRPGAFAHARPLREWRTTWPPSYLRLLDHLQATFPHGQGVKQFIQILRLHQSYTAGEIAAAVEQALARGCAHLAGVELCLYQQRHPDVVHPVLDLADHPRLQAVGSQPVNLQCYDTLLGERVS